MANVCGTGGWNGPLPGDPDNSSVLSATPEFGGIQVSWTLPSSNGFAVAYTKVYRSIADRFDTAIPLTYVSAGSFFDSSAATLLQPYYYWIQHVSINGTVLIPIGPVMAQAKPLLDQVIAGMANRLEETELSQVLRTRLDKIETLENGLTNLDTLVASENQVFAQELLGLKDDLTGSLAYFSQQRQLDISERAAFAQQVNQQISSIVTNPSGYDDTAIYAAIQEESQTRAEQTGALFAQKTIKLDLNGYVSGLGISASVDPDGEQNSDFQVRADTFSIAPPAINSNTTPPTPFNGMVWVDTSVTPSVTRWFNKTAQAWQTTPVKGASPFIYRTTPEVIDGYTIEPGMYVSAAFIDRITANQIDTRGLKIRDDQGNIIFGAGDPLDVTNIVGLGQLGLVDEINGSNATTYIKNGVITNALIGDVIQSTNFDIDANTGWRLDKSGSLYLTNLNAGAIDIRKLAGKAFYYLNPGTYTLTVSEFYPELMITLNGAGGGGGGSYSARQNRDAPLTWWRGGMGGNGGQHIAKLSNIAAGTTFTITVGAGGAGSQVYGQFNGERTIAQNGGNTQITWANGSVTAGGGAYGENATGTYGRNGVNGANGASGGTGVIGGGAKGGVGGQNSTNYGFPGANGFAVLEVYNPNGVILRSDWTTLVEHLNQRFSQYVWP